MIFISYNPFLRILFPFIIGISAWLLGYEKAPGFAAIIITYCLCILGWLTLIKKAFSFPKLIFGLLSQTFLLLAGWGLCQYNFNKENPTHYTYLLSNEPELFAGYISDLPTEKSKSLKAEVVLQQAKIKGKWQNASGKIIV